MNLRGLYAITPDIPDRSELFERVLKALEGGVTALQYRCKSLALWQRHEEAKMFALACRSRNARFIVNDSADIAIASGADGVHLGRDDGDIAEARERLGAKLLGVSCYDSLEDARAAVSLGADYIAFGSVFPSPTKPGATRAPLSLFAEARSLGVPLVAIGGITLENAPQVVAAGADAVAVISDLFDSAHIAARAREYGKLFGKHEITQ